MSQKIIKLTDKESQVFMTVKEFCEIPSNPRQRDTERHAKKARKSHLKTLCEIHKFVDVASLPNGDRYKLDGHTRAYLWQIGELEHPKVLVVRLRAAKNIQEVMKMYLEYDSLEAYEPNSDKFFGAVSQQNISFASSFMQNGKIITPLCLAKNGMIDSKATVGEGIYELVEYFREELLKIDNIQPSQKKFVGGIFAAALISTFKYGDKAIQFWDLYNRDLGVKSGKEKDAVQMLTELLESRRASNTLSSRSHVVDMCGRALAAFEKWMKRETYTGGIKCLDVMAYVKSMKRAK